MAKSKSQEKREAVQKKAVKELPQNEDLREAVRDDSYKAPKTSEK